MEIKRKTSQKNSSKLPRKEFEMGYQGGLPNEKEPTQTKLQSPNQTNKEEPVVKNRAEELLRV